ncbi:MAG: hypothetical protein NT076_00965 [Candidatus Pacearchaeota archaeon]|nr:hypothetical protein [Candidatus Pacearchaeota archaeon]
MRWQDGTFPSHDSNPMKPENLRQLRSLVSKGREFFCGATADGDADRIGMVDEKSRILHAHNITSLVVHNLMRNIKDEDINVVYTTTMGRSFRDAVEQYKGKGHRVPVGRVGVINKGLELMNQGKRVIIGAEGSNHIMFPDKRGKFYENTILATGAVINQCVRTGEKLSEIIDKTNKYDFLGEQNYRLPGEAKEAKEKVSQLMARLEKDYAGIVAGTLEKDDGTLVESREKGEWFSIRSSNTEPVIRMNVESTSEKRTCEISAKLEEIIAKFGGKSE